MKRIFEDASFMKMALSDVCSVSGLPIYGRPEWTDVSFGKNYSVTVRLLGDSVIYSKPSGYATRFDVENAFKLLRGVNHGCCRNLKKIRKCGTFPFLYVRGK